LNLKLTHDQTFIFLLFSFVAYNRIHKNFYKSNGNILDSESQKISPNQVRELKDNQQLLASYNDGRSKKNTWKHFDY
jgi:hypothetical protein